MRSYTRIVHLRHILLLSALITVCTLFATPAHAQIALPQTDGSIDITSKPRIPQPDSSVTLALDDYAFGGTGSEVYWYVDDVEQAASRNAREIVVPTGAAGSVVTAEVRLVRGGAVVARAVHTSAVTRVDIVLEADTYVPHFYKGRALPSTESTIHATALVHDGKGTSPASYTYQWTLGQDTLDGGPVKGKYRATIPVPAFSGSTLEVEVFDASGQLVAERIIPFTLVQPRLLFYVYSPLRGLLERAYAEVHMPSTSSVILYAEPYHLNTRTLTDPNMTITWKMGGRTATAHSAGPNTFLVAHPGNTNNVKIDATFFAKKQLLQYAQGSLTARFR